MGHHHHTFPKEEATLQHELTATRAYGLWQRAGRPEGRDWEFWFAAERELREAYGEMMRRTHERRGSSSSERVSARGDFSP